MALIALYTVFNLPFVVWMMRSYFDGVPAELEESALVDGSTRLSYGALRDAARTFGAALVACGVEPGDRVAIWAFNSVEWVVTVLGLFEAVCAPWRVEGIPEDFSFGALTPDWDRMAPYLEKAMATRLPYASSR